MSQCANQSTGARSAPPVSPVHHSLVHHHLHPQATLVLALVNPHQVTHHLLLSQLQYHLRQEVMIMVHLQLHLSPATLHHHNYLQVTPLPPHHHLSLMMTMDHLHLSQYHLIHQDPHHWPQHPPQLQPASPQLQSMITTDHQDHHHHQLVHLDQ